jgi:hypothetical protein
MDLGIITIILGIVLAVGIAFYKKPKPEEAQQDPIHSAYRRGMEILSPIVKWGGPVILIVIGFYYLITLSKEARLKQEAKERQAQLEKEEKERAIARQIHFHQILQIVDAPMNEKEMKILELDFDPKGTNYFGRVYERYPDEKIELSDEGTVRYLPKDKKSYLRVFNEAKLDSFLFQSENANNVGDKFAIYKKGPCSLSCGYFTDEQTYFCSVYDYTKQVSVPDFLPTEFLVGSWGRVSISDGGKYIFKGDNTFVFHHSREGSITGKWRTEDKNIVLNYDEKRGAYINHPLSMKTEIIHVTNKLTNSVNGYLSSIYERVTLSRQ